MAVGVKASATTVDSTQGMIVPGLLVQYYCSFNLEMCSGSSNTNVSQIGSYRRAHPL